MKKLLLVSFLVFMGFLTYEYINQLYIDWYYREIMISTVEKQASMSVSPTEGINIIVEDKTDWVTIFKLIVTLLSTYLGVKLINKFVQ